MTTRYISTNGSSRRQTPEADVATSSSKATSSLPIFPATSKSAIFTLSFWSYCAMKVSNKSYSLIQPILVKERFFSSEVFDTNYSGQTSMVGMISTIFLICYASGQFFAGALADRSNLRYFISMAMALAGLLAVFFGGMGLLNYRFGKKARGLVFSAWSSNSNIGNILGSVLSGLIFYIFSDSPVLWQLTMILCGLVAVVGMLPVFLFMVPDPADNSESTTQNKTDIGKSITIQVIPKAITNDPSSTYEHNMPSGSSSEVSECEEKEDDNGEDAIASQPSVRTRRLSVERFDVEEGVTVSHVTKTIKPSPSSTAVVTAPPPAVGFFDSFMSALSKRGVFAYAVIYACVKGVVYVYIYWMPLFLTSAKGMSNSQAAYVSTIFDIGAFIGGLFFGHVTDLLGSRTIVILGMVFSGTILASILFTTEASIMLICAILFFIGMSAGAAQILISGSVALDLGDDGGSSDDESKSKRQAATITGIIEGSGSAGAALLQYAVGALLVCDEDEDGDLTCTWDRVLLVLTVANVLSFSCLLYLKFSGRVKSIALKLYDVLAHQHTKKVLPMN